MKLFRYCKMGLKNMVKGRRIKNETEMNKSVLGKRKLDYSYSGFISSTVRPPLASPKLEKNSGVKHNVRSKERENKKEYFY